MKFPKYTFYKNLKSKKTLVQSASFLLLNKKFSSYPITNSFVINFGPQHPAAHGVLRLLVELRGEKVISVDPHIGLLHRGTEKLIERKKYLQAIPYFDRLDYVSMLSQEHAFVLAVEVLGNISVPLKYQRIRMFCDEITRLLNHIMSITTHALDVGAITPFLWGFEERERLMTIYEELSGARLHAAYYRPGGVSFPFPGKIFKNLPKILKSFEDFLHNLEEILTDNGIWRGRLHGIGCVSKKSSFSGGFSGPMIRASSIPWDLRVCNPYSGYDTFSFIIPVGRDGDSYSRYLVRIQEMKVSLILLGELLPFILDDFLNQTNGVEDFHDSKLDLKLDMESIIRHFELYGSGSILPKGSTYVSIEAPKGEFGVSLISDGSAIPSRCHIRSPGFYHLQGLHFMTIGHGLADVVTNIGSLDLVFGEVDR